MKGKIRVVIADDHAVVRQGLKQIIAGTSDVEIIDEAANGAELLEKVRNTGPDVVVMDIDMPGKSGWDVLIQLKSEFPKLPALVLSIHSEEDYAMPFLKGGAAGYLTKTSAPDQLLQAIRKVADGGKFITPTLAEKLVCDLAADSTKLPHEFLSTREFQVMCLLASGKTVSEIADDLVLSVPTISTYRMRILEKLGMKNNAQLTHYVAKHKLVN